MIGILEDEDDDEHEDDSSNSEFRFKMGRTSGSVIQLHRDLLRDADTPIRRYADPPIRFRPRYSA